MKGGEWLPGERREERGERREGKGGGDSVYVGGSRKEGHKERSHLFIYLFIFISWYIFCLPLLRYEIIYKYIYFFVTSLHSCILLMTYLIFFNSVSLVLFICLFVPIIFLFLFLSLKIFTSSYLKKKNYWLLFFLSFLLWFKNSTLCR